MDLTSLEMPKYKALVEEKQFETYLRLINPPPGRSETKGEILLFPPKKIALTLPVLSTTGGKKKKKDFKGVNRSD